MLMLYRDSLMTSTETIYISLFLKIKKKKYKIKPPKYSASLFQVKSIAEDVIYAFTSCKVLVTNRLDDVWPNFQLS